MRKARQTGSKRSERGVALILAIFTLMFISVIATALVLTAGTASAIKANYKSSMLALYDAKAGLEEGRGRLALGPSDAQMNTCVFSSGNPMPTTHVCYITNPNAAAGETSMDPSNSSDPYFDAEYSTEFGPFSGASVSKTASNSPLTSPSIAGPLYKWVRITPRTEKSGGLNVDGSANATDTNPLYYDGTNQTLMAGANASQVLTVTALAKTPSGGFSGTRLLQYTVAQNPNPLGQALTPPGSSVPPTLNQIFQAALTLDGNGVTYSGNVAINGQDSSVGVPSGTGVQAIAYTNSGDTRPSCGSSCQSATNPPVPVVGTVALPSQMQTVPGLEQLITAITLEASSVITGPADQSSLPSGMSVSNPMIVVVNGDFHLGHASGASAFTGYGLLLVTGTLYYDPDDSWNGVILVIGKGVFDGSQGGHNGQINGVVFVANTRDSSGNPLTTGLGPASYNGSGGGNGIRYSSSLMNNVQSMMPYQVLSFREIQTQ
jgi:hypothetical protein